MEIKNKEKLTKQFEMLQWRKKELKRQYEAKQKEISPILEEISRIQTVEIEIITKLGIDE